MLYHVGVFDSSYINDRQMVIFLVISGNLRNFIWRMPPTKNKQQQFEGIFLLSLLMMGGK